MWWSVLLPVRRSPWSQSGPLPQICLWHILHKISQSFISFHITCCKCVSGQFKLIYICVYECGCVWLERHCGSPWTPVGNWGNWWHRLKGRHRWSVQGNQGKRGSLRCAVWVCLCRWFNTCAFFCCVYQCCWHLNFCRCFFLMFENEKKKANGGQMLLA